MYPKDAFWSIISLRNYNFNEDPNTYLIGDLNFDAPGKNDLSKYLTLLNYEQLVKRATHLDGHVLDHVYVSQRIAKNIEIEHHYAYYSDHDGILVKWKKH